MLVQRPHSICYQIGVSPPNLLISFNLASPITLFLEFLSRLWAEHKLTKESSKQNLPWRNGARNGFGARVDGEHCDCDLHLETCNPPKSRLLYLINQPTLEPTSTPLMLFKLLLHSYTTYYQMKLPYPWMIVLTISPTTFAHFEIYFRSSITRRGQQMLKQSRRGTTQACCE